MSETIHEYGTVKPDAVTILNCVDGGAAVFATYQHRKVFEKAFSDKDEARTEAAKALVRSFPRPSEDPDCDF